MAIGAWIRGGLGLVFSSAVLVGVLTCTPSSFAASADEFRIATFNIQNFGKTKLAKVKVRKYLASVVRKFDVIAIQEISDVSEKVPSAFLDEVNSGNAKYKLLLSARTGRQPDDLSSQEQYAFYYNSKRVTAQGEAGLFEDGKDDLFQREPYTARFKLTNTGMTLSITQVHTQPARAVAEIDALYNVYESLKDRYPGESRHVVLGDFNGGCSYAKPEKLSKLKIRGAAFMWVVPDNADTMVTSDCAHDRVILNQVLRKRFVRWGVGDWFTDKSISDHLPVWLVVK